MGFKDKLAGHVESITRGSVRRMQPSAPKACPQSRLFIHGWGLPSGFPFETNRQRAADDNARCRLDSDGDCHPFCSPNVNGPE